MDFQNLIGQGETRGNHMPETFRFQFRFVSLKMCGESIS